MDIRIMRMPTFSTASNSTSALR